MNNGSSKLLVQVQGRRTAALNNYMNRSEMPGQDFGSIVAYIQTRRALLLWLICN